MWRFFISLIVSLSAPQVFAVAPTPLPPEAAWFNMECARIFDHTRSHKLLNDEAELVAREFLAKAGIAATPVICSGSGDIFQLAASQMRPYGFDRYFFIMFDTQFRRAAGSNLRGVIAHEVAHLVARGGTTCNKEIRAYDVDAYVRCEHDVDVAADQLTNPGEVPRMLRWVIHYLDTQLSNVHPGRAEEQMRYLHRRVILIDRAIRQKGTGNRKNEDRD